MLWQEHVHDRLVAAGPVAFGEAVHQANVQVIDSQFAAETVEVGASRLGLACPSFREEGYFVAMNVLERFPDVGMTSIGIRGIEEEQALVIAVEQQAGKPLNAEPRLMRAVADADGAGSHGEAAGLDAGFAENNGVGGVELCGQARDRKRECGKSLRAEPGS